MALQSAITMCLGGETGRRAGFKIRFLHGSVGSIPTPGTSVYPAFLDSPLTSRDRVHLSLRWVYI